MNIDKYFNRKIYYIHQFIKIMIFIIFMLLVYTCTNNMSSDYSFTIFKSMDFYVNLFSSMDSEIPLSSFSLPNLIEKPNLIENFIYLIENNSITINLKTLLIIFLSFNFIIFGLISLMLEKINNYLKQISKEIHFLHIQESEKK